VQIVRGIVHLIGEFTVFRSSLLSTPHATRAPCFRATRGERLSITTCAVLSPFVLIVVLIVVVVVEVVVVLVLVVLVVLSFRIVAVVFSLILIGTVIQFCVVVLVLVVQAVV
jgi:hypothetical protein